MTKRILLSGLACGVIIAVTGLLAHTVIAHGFFYAADVTGTYYRPEGPWRSFVIPGTLLEGFAFAWLYSRMKRSGAPLRDGLTYAAAVGVFMFALVIVIQYGICQIASAAWIGGEAVYLAVQVALMGIAVGAIQRNPSTQ